MGASLQAHAMKEKNVRGIEQSSFNADGEVVTT